MFGFLYALFAGGAIIKDNIENSIEDQNSRERAIQKGNCTYYDTRGGLHHINPHGKNLDEACYRTTDNNGHDVLMTIKDHRVIKDYTWEALFLMDVIFEREAKKAKEEAIKSGKKYYSVKFVDGLRFPNYCLINDGCTYTRDFSGKYDKRLEYRYLVENDIAYKIVKNIYGTGKNKEVDYRFVIYDVNKFDAVFKTSKSISLDDCRDFGPYMDYEKY